MPTLDEARIAQLTSDGVKPKILYVDLETSPILGWAWDGYETTLLDIEQDSKIISFAYQWEGEDRVKAKALTDFPYKPNRFKIDDRDLVFALYELFQKADMIVAQNGDRFDVRVANARFLYYQLPPPAEYKTVDTLKVARKYFKMPFHSLDHMCRYMGIERKVDAGGKGTWFRCMDGDAKAWRHMIYYNKKDVDCLREVYKRMRGWHKTHPNLSFLTRNNGVCPTCQSRKFKRDGYRYLRIGKQQVFECTEKLCGARWKGPIIKIDPSISSY